VEGNAIVLCLKNSWNHS